MADNKPARSIGFLAYPSLSGDDLKGLGQAIKEACDKADMPSVLKAAVQAGLSLAMMELLDLRFLVERFAAKHRELLDEVAKEVAQEIENSLEPNKGSIDVSDCGDPNCPVHGLWQSGNKNAAVTN